jgi:hypothetical protein
MVTAVPATPFTIPILAGRRNEMTFTQDELQEIAMSYLPREGGFASALAEAYLKADLSNQRRIEGAFGDLFVTAYRKWAPEGEMK